MFFNRFVDAVSLEAYFADKEVTIDLLAREEGCLKLYNAALNESKDFRLNFANAYADALNIVKQKNTTIGGLVDLVTDSLGKLADKITPVLTEENIDKIAKISDDISKGEFSVDAIAEAVGKAIK